MLSPEYYESCADDVIRLYEQLEDDIISDVIRRIMKSGKVTSTARHRIEQLQGAGILYDDILNAIASQTDATSQHVKALFEDAGVETVRFDNRIYRENGLTPVDIRQSPAMRRTLEAGYRKTLGNMKNLTIAINEVPVLNKYTIGTPFCVEVPYIDKNGKEITNTGFCINDEIFELSDIDVIILHELGHYIDFKFIDYDKKAFARILVDDFENFQISNIHLNEEEWNRKLGTLVNNAGQLEDIISGVTKGKIKIKGKYTHNKSYWKDEEKLPAETFAHFFEATIRNDKLKIQTYKEVFPNAYKTFLGYFDL